MVNNNTAIAWAAGIIDGEGCIHIRHSPASQHPGCKSPRHTLTVKVTMGCLKTVKHLLKIFDLGCVADHQPKGPRQNASYSWIVQSQNAHDVLVAVRPYLITKAAEADIAIEFQNLPKYSRGSDRRLVDPKVFEARHRLYIELRKLKPRYRFSPIPKTFEHTYSRPRHKLF